MSFGPHSISKLPIFQNYLASCLQLRVSVLLPSPSMTGTLVTAPRQGISALGPLRLQLPLYGLQPITTAWRHTFLCCAKMFLCFTTDYTELTLQAGFNLALIDIKRTKAYPMAGKPYHGTSQSFV